MAVEKCTLLAVENCTLLESSRVGGGATGAGALQADSGSDQGAVLSWRACTAETARAGGLFSAAWGSEMSGLADRTARPRASSPSWPTCGSVDRTGPDPPRSAPSSGRSRCCRCLGKTGGRMEALAGVFRRVSLDFGSAPLAGSRCPARILWSVDAGRVRGRTRRRLAARRSCGLRRRGGHSRLSGRNSRITRSRACTSSRPDTSTTAQPARLGRPASYGGGRDSACHRGVIGATCVGTIDTFEMLGGMQEEGGALSRLDEARRVWPGSSCEFGCGARRG